MVVTQELAGGLALPLLGAAPLGSVPRLTPGRSCHTLNLLDWLSTKQELPLTSTPTDLCGAFSTPAVIQTSGCTPQCEEAATLTMKTDGKETTRSGTNGRDISTGKVTPLGWYWILPSAKVSSVCSCAEPNLAATGRSPIRMMKAAKGCTSLLNTNVAWLQGPPPSLSVTVY